MFICRVFRAIRSSFNVSAAMVQLTVSLFLLLTGVGQLLAGPVSDYLVRKKVILCGAIVFLLGCVLAAISPNIFILIAARMLQGLGAASMMVATFAMVRDLFSGDESASVFSFLNSGIALSPLIAPIIGGYLAKWYGWRMPFVFLSVMTGLTVLLAMLKVKESLPVTNRNKKSKKVFCEYLSICNNHHFKMFAFAAAAGFACFLTFFSVSSYILIVLLGVPEQHFGFYFALIGVIFFIGSMISGYTSKKLGTYYSVLIASFLVLVGGVVMLVWYYAAGLSIAAFLVPMLIMAIGGAMLMGGGAGGAIEPFPEKAGAAAAVFGASEFLFAFIVSTIVLEWQVVSTIPLAITLILLGGASAFVLVFFKKYK